MPRQTEAYLNKFGQLFPSKREAVIDDIVSILMSNDGMNMLSIIGANEQELIDLFIELDGC